MCWVHFFNQISSDVFNLIQPDQIPGLRHEPSGLLGIIRRWDCDRYLALSFRCCLMMLVIVIVNMIMIVMMLMMLVKVKVMLAEAQKPWIVGNNQALGL